MSKELQLTPWFPENVKPARPGVYETQMTGVEPPYGHGYSHWNGERWSDTSKTRRIPAWKKTAIGWPTKVWRGLVNDPRTA